MQGDHCGHGVGARLLNAVRDHAMAIGVTELQSQTPAWNEDAQRFYTRASATGLPKMRFTLQLNVWTEALSLNFSAPQPSFSLRWHHVIASRAYAPTRRLGCEPRLCDMKLRCRLRKPPRRTGSARRCATACGASRC
ncbi:GNAT family N-acetyltransferase [Acidisoma silvae]|uniref:GNAT family N-acetyltransferase n=1 Tax=Acidisoma silvae TaxID=2802396 RepID=A0A963YVZ2_9PROT|nr:GNAT family N-acetyltransferase [Acidisoma silvae]